MQPPRGRARGPQRARSCSAAARNERQRRRPSSFHVADPFAASPSQQPGTASVALDVLRDPALELRLCHLGMELDAPARVAEPKPLQTGRIARERDSARPGGRARSGATRAPRSAAAARRGRDRRRPPPSARPRTSRSRARASGPTQAPAARARSCEPRQMPSVGAVPLEQLASQSTPPAATDAGRPGRGASRRRRRAPRRRRRAGAEAASPQREAPLVEPVAGLGDDGPNSSVRASSPWTSERTSIADLRAAARRDPVHVEEPPQLPRVRRRLRDAARADCRDPPTRRCC